MTKNVLKIQTNDRKPQPLTAVWRNGGFSASYDSFVLRNPPERKARKRYAQIIRHSV